VFSGAGVSLVHVGHAAECGRCKQRYVLSAVKVASAIVLVLDFLGRGKRTDCQQRSKIENEDEDDWGGKLYRAKHAQATPLQRRRLDRARRAMLISTATATYIK